jgi:chlorobactene glucosyltransferase
MVHYLSQDLLLHLIIFQAVLLLIALSNAHVLWRTARQDRLRSFPQVSVLVPARNEERNIARCIASLLAQDYPAFEVIALDDQSTDSTQAILERIAHVEMRLRVLPGQPIPPGWLGKNWACAQLAAQAVGDLLLFTDADTFHKPQALRACVTALQGEHADLLTGFPRQVMHTWGERFIVPFFGWVFYCFMPLWLAYRLKAPALSIAVGQMLLFRRTAYDAIGGHAAVRASVAEDLDLARRIKACGYRWRVLDATRLISCRMYGSGREAYGGLCKNLFAAFGFRVLPYLFAWLWLAMMFLEPPLLLGAHALGLAPQAQAVPILLCMGLSLALWLVPYQRLGLPWYLGALYPLTLLVIEWVAACSLRLSVTGRLVWKGRALVRPQLRWF